MQNNHRGDRNKSGGPGPRNRGHSQGKAQSKGIPEGENLVLVQFKGHRKGYFHNFRALNLNVGQYCLVEADRGQDMGRVIYIGPGKPSWWDPARKQGVISVAGPKELDRLHENRGDEWEFWDICQEKIQGHRLNMSLVSVERQYDHKKITFFFTAEKRVDFRELVRDLAAVFRTRIELRQIGVRDEARLKGGLGVCGREFCCSSFLQDFVPVTLKMAKVQQLPLNPGKLSGPCGRLRCCMGYENQLYELAHKKMPMNGTVVDTAEGPGKVRKIDLLQEVVWLEMPEKENLVPFKVEKVTWDRRRNMPDPRSVEGSRGRGSRGEGH